MQTTLKSPACFTGQGLHSGQPARMVVHPASADYGIWFRRTDVLGMDAMIPAAWNAVQASRLCTLVANEAGVSVSTIEHLMAALAGCGIHNALIEIDGPEVPILDGSAAPFAAGFMARGLIAQDAPARVIRVLDEIEVRDGDAVARLSPADTLEMEFHIDFTDAAIGRQDKTMTLSNGAFLRELCDSRTFCRQSDVDAMRAAGLALGGTYDNAVVVDGADVLSPGGLRHADEPVRHKMLDALGDLSLAGAPLLARYSGHRAGHALTNRLLHALFARPGAWAVELCDAETARRLPGADIKPADLRLVA